MGEVLRGVSLRYLRFRQRCSRRCGEVSEGRDEKCRTRNSASRKNWS